MRAKLSINIGWLYPELMSTYGDRGNILVLLKRCLWRSITAQVINIGFENKSKDLLSCDLLFMGGAQDRQQKIVASDLYKNKGNFIKEMVSKGTPALFVCAAYQFMGHYYQPNEGNKIEGLHLFDLHTLHFGNDKPRCIGNVIIKVQSSKFKVQSYVVGFENHGGRTYLGKGVQPLGKVIKGYGNNGADKTEGCVYKNAIGSYLHGPILPKNPFLADWLIKIALERKYQKEVKLKKLDDRLEYSANQYIQQRYEK